MPYDGHEPTPIRSRCLRRDVSKPCLAAPASLVDAVRARIAPLFPEWSPQDVEVLVCQIAAVEWRYSVGPGAPGQDQQPDNRIARTG